MSIRDEVRALPPYGYRDEEPRVKLDQNEAPEDLPPALRAEALRRVEGAPWNRYPGLQPRPLMQRLADLHDWPEAGVVVAPGSNVLIQALALVAALNRRVVTVAPTFAVYGLQARLLNAELRAVPLRDDFSLDVPALATAMDGGEGVLFLPDPAAPTGNRLDDDAVEAVLDDALARGYTPVLDEAYVPFDGRDRLAWIRDHPGAVVLRTLSKAFGLAGVRLGYALTDPDTAEQVGKALLPFSVSALQIEVAAVALDHPEYVRERVAALRDERARVRARLQALPGAAPWPSDANYLLFRVDDPEAVHRGLLARGVALRRQDHLPGLHGALRMTVGTPEENDAALDALTEVLGATPAPEAAHG